MANVKLFDQTGKEVSTVELNDAIFGIEPNESVVFDVVISQRASLRQGTHAVKNRSAVSGGGRKPWRQKGTGRARQGSIRATQFRGGGTVFGATPRNYAYRINKKVRRLAVKSALSEKVQETAFSVLDKFEIAEPKTKLMVSALKSLNVSGKTLIVADVKADENKNLELAARNIPSVKIILPSNLNVKDLLEADFVVMTESAVNDITERLQ